MDSHKQISDVRDLQADTLPQGGVWGFRRHETPEVNVRAIEADTLPEGGVWGFRRHNDKGNSFNFNPGPILNTLGNGRGPMRNGAFGF